MPAGNQQNQGELTMASNAETNRELAARLLQALEGPDELTHEQAQALLPALIEAQLAGEDTDSDPAYTAVLRHLDRCDVCLAVYEQLSEELEAMISGDEPLPSAQLTPPTFFVPALRTEHAVLRIIRGIKSRFQLDLKVPPLRPDLQLLSSEEQLFAEELPGLPGAPFVAVALTVDQGAAELAVVVRQPNATTRWQVRLMQGDYMRTEMTDAAGIARFTGLDVENLTDVQLYCSEITD
jgi:hypothetical protein